MTEMSQWIDKVYIPTLFIALIVYHTDAYSSVTLDDVNCDSRVIYVSTQQSQRVEWKGTVIPKRCRVGFEATESPHAVCVDVEVFRDYKCTFTVKVYTEFSDSAIRTYDCDSTGTAKERCFDNKMIYLGFTFNTTGRSVNPSVKIEVKNKVDEDGSGGLSWVSIVSIVIGLLQLSFCLFKWGGRCIRKCIIPLCESITDGIYNCFCGETVTHDRSSSSEHVPEEASISIPMEPSPTPLAEANGNLSLASSTTSLVRLIGNILGGLVITIFITCGIVLFYNVCKGGTCCEELKPGFEAVRECTSILLCGLWKIIVDFWGCGKKDEETRTEREVANNEQTLVSSQSRSSGTNVHVVTGNAANLTRGISMNSLDSLEINDESTVLPEGNGREPPFCVDPDPETSFPDVPPPSYYDVVREGNTCGRLAIEYNVNK